VVQDAGGRAEGPVLWREGRLGGRAEKKKTGGNESGFFGWHITEVGTPAEKHKKNQTKLGPAAGFLLREGTGEKGILGKGEQ